MSEIDPWPARMAEWDAKERAAERRFRKLIWRHHRIGWLAEIDCDAMFSPVAGWGSTWRPTERSAHAWADRRIRRHLARIDREDARREARDAARKEGK